MNAWVSGEPNVRQITEANTSAVTPDALGKPAATHTPRLTKKNLDSHTSCELFLQAS